MFRQVFDPNNLFWRLIARGVDFVGLGLFWLALCLPIVTIGPATAALYYTVVKVFRQREEGGFGILWKQFCANLKKGCLATLICLPFAAVFAFGYFIMDANKTNGTIGVVMFVAYWVALLVPAGIFCWLWPVMARFEQGLKGCFSNAFMLALRHLPSTFILVLLNLELIIFCLERWWPVFFCPVLGSLLGSLFQEKIFLKYLSDEDKAALQGVYPEEE